MTLITNIFQFIIDMRVFSIFTYNFYLFKSRTFIDSE